MRTRLLQAMSPTAFVASVLALAVAGAGIGYSAATIGTGDLKNNAVTSPKIKNGTVKGADLSKQEKYKYVGDNGVDFSTGTEGDCIWHSYSELVPALEGPGYRMDRDGVVHLTGIGVAEDGPGGDGMCGDESPEDGIAFTLPKKYQPARAQLLLASSTTLLVVGKDPVEGVPPGSVFVGDPTTPFVLTGISFPARGTALATNARATDLRSPHARAVLRQLLRTGGR